MNSYKVKIIQYAEEVATLTVEAPTASEAIKKVTEDYRKGELDLDWSDGSGVHDDVHVTVLWGQRSSVGKQVRESEMELTAKLATRSALVMGEVALHAPNGSVVAQFAVTPVGRALTERQVRSIAGEIVSLLEGTKLNVDDGADFQAGERVVDFLGTDMVVVKVHARLGEQVIYDLEKVDEDHGPVFRLPESLLTRKSKESVDG